MRKATEKELVKWGVKFYEMGYNEAVRHMGQATILFKDIKINTVKEYALKCLKEEQDNE